MEEKRATLTLSLTAAGPTEEQLRAELATHRLEITRYAGDYDAGTGERVVDVDLRWRNPAAGEKTPSIVASLAGAAGVLRVKWDPKV